MNDIQSHYYVLWLWECLRLFHIKVVLVRRYLFSYQDICCLSIVHPSAALWCMRQQEALLILFLDSMNLWQKHYMFPVSSNTVFLGRYLTCYKSIPGFPSGRGVVYVSSKINSFITPIGRNGKLRDPSGRTISKVVGCVKGYYDPIALKRKI